MAGLLPLWIAHWAAMGGYAAFVWPAYGIAAFVLGGLSLYCWRRHRGSGAMLARLQPPDETQ